MSLREGKIDAARTRRVDEISVIGIRRTDATFDTSAELATARQEAGPRRADRTPGTSGSSQQNRAKLRSARSHATI